MSPTEHSGAAVGKKRSAATASLDQQPTAQQQPQTRDAPLQLDQLK